MNTPAPFYPVGGPAWAPLSFLTARGAHALACALMLPSLLATSRRLEQTRVRKLPGGSANPLADPALLWGKRKRGRVVLAPAPRLALAIWTTLGNSVRQEMGMTS